MSKQKVLLIALSLGLNWGLFAQESGRISRLEEYLLKASSMNLHHQVLDSAPIADRLGLSTPEFHKIYGWSLYQLNQTLRAARQYAQALKQNQYDSIAQTGLYVSLRDAGETQEAHFWRNTFSLKDNGSRFCAVEGIWATGNQPNFGNTFIPDSSGAAISAWQNNIIGFSSNGQFPISRRTILSFGLSTLNVQRSSRMEGIELILKDSTLNTVNGTYTRNYSLDTISNWQQMGITQNQGLIHISHRLATNFHFQIQYQIIDIQSTFQQFNIREEAFQFQPTDVIPSYRIRHDFNFRNERFQDQILMAGFHWRYKNIKWMMTAGLRSFYGSNAPLMNIEMVWNPFGNTHTYLIPGWNTDFSTTIASLQAGVKVLKGTWLESQFFYGNLTGAITNSGAIVWNLPDKTRLRITVSLLKRLSNWGEISLRYGYTELEASRTEYRLNASEQFSSFKYNLYSFVTGLKIFF